ncbi:MAG: hypothetical protein GXX10_07510 [Clostridiaceae bacterium]|nr:hypothetical protein [Clostridiaceae bacterium]
MKKRIKAIIAAVTVFMLVFGMTCSFADSLPGNGENEEKAEVEESIKDTLEDTVKELEPESNGIKPFELVAESKEEIEITLTERLERLTVLAREIKEVYSVKSNGIRWGYITFDIYSFENGDLYYYLKYEALGDKGKDIAILLPFKPDNFDLRIIEYPKGFDVSTSKIGLYTEQTIERNVLDEFAPTSVYLDSEKLNMYLSYTSVYTKRSFEIREEDYKSARNVLLTNQGIKVFMPFKTGGFSEQWGIISTERLVNWEDKDMSEAVRIADLNRVRKWGGDGTYYEMPVGYSPYYKNGFYRNSANHIGNKCIQSSGRLCEDFGYITMDVLLKTQNYYGYWSTTPIADWLYNDYKIGPGFFDTRWDTEGAQSLLRAYVRFKEPSALEGAVKFADFFCEFAENHSYKTKNGGLLVYDYGFTLYNDTKTHVSLNHLLNEMNFLFEIYIATGNAKYLNVAEKILTGIRDTQKNWVKSNGDLHYAYMGNGKYGREDYPVLTFNDLRYSQSLIKKIYGKEDTAIASLAASKEKYLKNHNIAY